MKMLPPGNVGWTLPPELKAGDLVGDAIDSIWLFTNKRLPTKEEWAAMDNCEVDSESFWGNCPDRFFGRA